MGSEREVARGEKWGQRRNDGAEVTKICMGEMMAELGGGGRGGEKEEGWGGGEKRGGLGGREEGRVNFI